MLEPVYEELYGAIRDSAIRCTSGHIALSGGLDSTIIAYLLGERRPDAVAVIADDFIATDLTYCQLASKEFEMRLHIEGVGTDRMLEAAEQTIRILGNFNDIEIRNSIVMYVAALAVKGMGGTGLITGDGADELFAGYNFFLSMPEGEVEAERERIMQTMHFPSHKIGEHLGVRIESPFLAGMVREIAGRLSARHLIGRHDGTIYGKYILRRMFEGKIPRGIVWRPKSAMQDGSGTGGLTGMFDSVIPDEEFESKRGEIAKADGVRLRTKESMYYYTIYKKQFGAPEASGAENSCPYCKGAIGEGSRFCRLCGAFPV